MRAVLVAAGEGTRMRPLTAKRPKPTLPVGDRSLLARVMDACRDHVSGFVLVVGYRGDRVREAVGDTYRGVPVEYVEQAEQLGTAHALECARDRVDGRFLLLNGDVLVEEALVAALAREGGSAMAVMPVEDPRAYGVVAVEGDRVVDVVEKPADPPSNLANLGCYAFEPGVIEHVAATERGPRGEYELTDAIRRYVDAGGEVTAVEHEGRWLDVGRPWELLAATEAVLADRERRVEGEVAGGATLTGPVVVEEGARVRAGAVVEGPVLVRSGAEVGPNAHLRPASVVGPDARVGHAVEVKNSVLMAGAAVGHLSYVGDSVLGERVNFGAGTVVANLRHDEAPVRMRVKGEPVDTGRRKLGVVVGDDAKTGIDTSLNAGVKLGADATTMPDETVTRDVETVGGEG